MSMEPKPKIEPLMILGLLALIIISGFGWTLYVNHTPIARDNYEAVKGVLESSKEVGIATLKGGNSHFLEISLSGRTKNFRVDLNKSYFDHLQFSKEISRGDPLKILVSKKKGQWIAEIESSGKLYMKFEDYRDYLNEGRNIWLYISIGLSSLTLLFGFFAILITFPRKKA